MNDRARLLLPLIVLASGILGYLMLDRGHSWGDDFAAYILQAQGLSDGNLLEIIQRSAFTIEQSSSRFGPVMVPWGLPLLLAPVYAAVGTELLAFKLLLTCCYVAFLPVYYNLSRTRLSQSEALLLTAFMAFNLTMLRAQNEILADLPFLLWSTSAIFLIEDQRRRPLGSTRAVVGAVACGAAVFTAWLTRPNGALLLLPLIAAQVILFRSRGRITAMNRREVAQVLLPYVVLAAAQFGQKLTLPSSTVGLREQWQGLSWSTMRTNLSYYLLLPGGFLRSSMSGGYFLYGVLFLGALTTAVRRWKQELPILLYCVSTLALYIAFPPRQGPRYLYPVLPLFFLLAMQGLKIIAAALPVRMHPAADIGLLCLWLLPTVVSLAFAINSAWHNLSAGRQPPSGPYAPAAAEMFAFIRNATPAQSVIMFFKPRAMRLITGRDAFMSTNCSDLSKADFVVVSTEGGTGGQVRPSRIRWCNSNVRLTREFARGEFEVYAIQQRSPGSTP